MLACWDLMVIIVSSISFIFLSKEETTKQLNISQLLLNELFLGSPPRVNLNQ